MNILPILFSFILILITFNNPEPDSRIDLNKGLLAYYSFNYCDARDETNNESNGILHGNVNCWCGVDDDGLLLDGKRDFIEFPGRVNEAFNTTDFTISFYVKSEQYSLFDQSLFSKRASCDSIGMLDIRLDVTNKIFNTDVFETEFKYYPNLVAGFEENGWVHYALVRKGTMAYTYVNGVLQNKGRRCSGVDISNPANLMFSNSPCIGGVASRRFKGILDELYIYERALSDDEIMLLYLEHPIESAKKDCLT